MTDVLTKQPVYGRSKNGVFRVSILHLYAFAAIGASNFIHGKIHTLSNKFDVDVCLSCVLQTTGEKVARVPISISLCCKDIASNVDFPSCMLQTTGEKVARASISL